MKFRQFGAALALASTIVFAPTAAQAAIQIDGSLGPTNPTVTTRLFRDGNASTCGSPKAFPGTFGSGPLAYQTHTVYNTGPSQCVTVNVDVGTCGTNVFVGAYLGSVDPGNLGTNYLADQGSSVTQPFSFVAPAGSTIALLVTNTSGVPTPACTYTITSSELMAAAAPTEPVAVPTLAELALLLLSGLLALVTMAQLRRR